MPEDNSQQTPFCRECKHALFLFVQAALVGDRIALEMGMCKQIGCPLCNQVFELVEYDATDLTSYYRAGLIEADWQCLATIYATGAMETSTHTGGAYITLEKAGYIEQHSFWMERYYLINRPGINALRKHEAEKK